MYVSTYRRFWTLRICLFVATASSQTASVVITHHESSRLGAPDSVVSVKGKSSKKDAEESSRTTSQAGDAPDATVDASNGVVAGNSTGTDKFYPLFTDRLCKKDCPSGDSFECAGVLGDTVGMSLFDTVEECCTEAFGWIDVTLCTALSANTTTDLFYVSIPDEACKKHCPVDPATFECGGTPQDLATALFETVDECCAAKLPHIDEALCVAISTNTSTNKFYLLDDVCKQDCPIDPTTFECGGNPRDVSATLYDTIEECCAEKLAFIDESLCVAIATNTSTDSFYVSGDSCKQDCPIDPVAFECGGTPDDLSTTLFGSLVDCCSEKLAYIDGSLCVAISTNTSTDKFYVSYSEKMCKQDCPVDPTTFECGGTPEDLSTPLYATVEECCSEKLAFIDLTLCTAVSLNETTDKFYVSYTDKVCKKDCPVGESFECGGTPEDLTTKLFETVEACCSEKLSYIDESLCAALSLNQTTDKFYVSYPDEKCLKDCPVGDAPECGGPPGDLSTALFETAAECCIEKLSYIDESLCSALSLNKTTDKFYVSYHDEACKKDCPVGEAPECGGIPEDTSVTLFETVEECCAEKLAYIDESLCVAMSLNTTTDKFYVSYHDEACKADCPVGEAPECGGTPEDSSVTLFLSVEKCCAEKLAYIDGALCVALSLNKTTDKFYVSYPDESCKKDCPVGDSPECGGSPADLSTTLFDTVENCCVEKLAYIDKSLCTATSLNKTTDLFYVNGEVCKKDCPVGSEPECGGTPEDSSTKLFESVEECCTQKLAYIDVELCAALSLNKTTDKFYVSYPDESCKKDCPVGDAPECGGAPADLSTTLFDTAEECCVENLAYIDKRLCAAISTNQHTNLFYVSYPDEACKKDCPAEDGGQCGGTPADLSIHLFGSVSECCKEKLSWVELSECVAAV
ncbi:hypothetical protein HJC23_006466 [Cyclotella cryptica]|uniref:Uncharacterized protein n=1 Tax=Cyclotella cryptica TaxID=29204 RepID=A0ABD3R0U6_9STRA|eukprot:CCRYP_001895-RA/>CCRYP_001895-RA protein AED:0.06 eAED:0.06 QI:0/-1/0/1/-1/1/1/0/914